MQQQQQLDLQREQLQLLQEQHQALEDQQRAGASTLKQPDDTVLKAAYCTGVISAQLEAERGAVAGFRLPAKYAESAKSHPLDAKLERVKAYVYQREATLEPGPVLGAVQQGKDDVAHIGAQTASCFSQCPTPSKDTLKEVLACNTQCLEESDAYQHAKICQQLSFLPY